MRSDPKGLYAKAKTRRVGLMPGLHDQHDEPLGPEVAADTEPASVDQCANKIIRRFRLHSLGL
jgi:adenylylsulfate kinase-like enzyme